MSRQEHIDRDTIALSQRSQAPATTFDTLMMYNLFLCMLRNPTFFDEARNVVKENQFNEATEPHYRLLWRSMCNLRDSQHTWSYLDMIVECHMYLKSHPGAFVPELQHALLDENPDGIIWHAFTFPAEHINVQNGRNMLKMFLHERTIAQSIDQLMQSVPEGMYPEKLGEHLDAIQAQREAIEGMSGVPYKPVVPSIDEVRPPSSVIHPTGIRFIDSVFGGQREGDANGIIGVTGTGKSTMAGYMAVKSAKIAYDDAIREGKSSPDLSAFFTYEESMEKMVPRIWSSALKISRKKLETLTNPRAELTTRANMDTYEQSLEKGDDEQYLSEQERWQLHSGWVNKSLEIYDMSGSEEYPHAGQGYIAEMASILDTRRQARGSGVRSVYIDYAGLVVERHMAAQNMSEDSTRLLLAKFGNTVKREIAQRFNCTVWIFHQVAGTMMNSNPTSLINHNMAAESKSFAVNLATCGCMGTVDPITGCRRFNWSKVRFIKQEDVSPVTLRINEEFAQMEDVTADYVVDEALRSFVSRSEANQVHGGDTDATPTQDANSAVQAANAMAPHVGRFAEMD